MQQNGPCQRTKPTFKIKDTATSVNMLKEKWHMSKQICYLVNGKSTKRTDMSYLKEVVS